MSFLQNGSFEALASKTPTNSANTSETNPFGLKDFAGMLDKKFGNSAFSDNLLAAPPSKSTNPFDTSNWEKPDIGDYHLKNPKNKNVKAVKSGGADTGDTAHSANYNNSPTSIFKDFQLNKGTGMACGGSGRHKLDFCY